MHRAEHLWFSILDVFLLQLLQLQQQQMKREFQCKCSVGNSLVGPATTQMQCISELCSSWWVVAARHQQCDKRYCRDGVLLQWVAALEHIPC